MGDADSTPPHCSVHPQPSPCCVDEANIGWMDQPPQQDPVGPCPHCSLQRRVSPRGCIAPPTLAPPNACTPGAAPARGSGAEWCQPSLWRGWRTAVTHFTSQINDANRDINQPVLCNRQRCKTGFSWAAVGSRVQRLTGKLFPGTLHCYKQAAGMGGKWGTGSLPTSIATLLPRAEILVLAAGCPLTIPPCLDHLPLSLQPAESRGALPHAFGALQLWGQGNLH